MPYLGLLAGDGHNGLRLIARYDGDIPGWGGLARNDKFYVADFNGDGRKDLLVFNGDDWSMTYVAMLRSTGTGFSLVRRFDGDIPGWGGLARHDQLFVGDYQRRRTRRPLHLQRRRLEHELCRDVPRERVQSDHDQAPRRRHSRAGAASPSTTC